MRLLLIFIIWTGILYPVISETANADRGSRSFVDNEILVVFSPDAPQPSAWLSNQGYSVVRSIRPAQGKGKPRAGIFQVKIPSDETVGQAMYRLKNRPGIAIVQPNYIYRLNALFPNDPSFSLQWSLYNRGVPNADIGAPFAWNTTTGNPSIIVAIIDTGIDYNHPDLQGNLWINPGEIPGDGIDNDGNGYVDDWRGWDFEGKNNDPWDDHSHGTHVGGIIGAVGNNALGISGVCWNVQMMPLDAFNSAGEALTSDLVEAVEYANLMGARIINASWGDQYHDQLLENAIRAFTTAWGIFVCAAGNAHGKDNDRYSLFPANYAIDGLISVGASTSSDQIAGFSSIGANTVHLFAPGSLIYSTYPTNLGNYGYKSGTSMASPMVAGAAALLWSWDGSLPNLEVAYRIIGEAVESPAFENKSLSGGRLSAANLFTVNFGAPASILDLSVTGVSYDRIHLSYTVTGADGLLGTARFVDIRYSTSPIAGNNWDYAFRAFNEPRPGVSGTMHHYTLSPLDENTTYYIRMKVIDPAGRHSSLSNQAVLATASVPVLFYDDVEFGVGLWTQGGTARWGITHVYARSGSYSWADSPFGQYQKGTNDLISPPLDLSTAVSPVLRFWHRYDIEPRSYVQYAHDFAEVRVSTDGITWSEPLAKYWDAADWWMLETLDLSAYRGFPEVRILFRFQADNSLFYNGWSVDDIRVLDVGSLSVDGWVEYVNEPF